MCTNTSHIHECFCSSFVSNIISDTVSSLKASLVLQCMKLLCNFKQASFLTAYVDWFSLFFRSSVSVVCAEGEKGTESK